MTPQRSSGWFALKRVFRRPLSILLGPVLALAAWFLLPPEYQSLAGEAATLSDAGRATFAVLVWMGWWWLTEAIDVPATALLPVALFPLLGIATFGAAATPYADSIVFLFLGGFVLAQSMQRWGLDRRIALAVISVTGTRPAGLIFGVMLATAVLSMWVSNTATAAMMLPIAASLVDLMHRRPDDVGDAPQAGEATPVHLRNFGVAMMLGMAYAASIGGIGTIIGSPPNGIVVEYIRRNFDREIEFWRWMAIGLPIVAVFLPACWLLLLALFPCGATRLEGGAELIRRERAALGPINRGEWTTAIVFGVVSATWIARPWLTQLEFDGMQPLRGLTDGGIALLGALSLFLLPGARIKGRPGEHAPVEPTMDWKTAEGLPWGVLLLFGGGLSLAAALETNGVAAYLAAKFSILSGAPTLLVVVLLALAIVVLSELASNTATAATMMPLMAALAPALGMSPYSLIFTAGLAASCGFMLPVATPPNAIVFGSGRVPLGAMYKAGSILDLMGVAIITLAAYTVVTWLV